MHIVRKREYFVEKASTSLVREATIQVQIGKSRIA